MAGGAYVVKKNAAGNEVQAFGSSLPSAGSGAVQSRSWSNGGGAAVYYDKTVADEIMAGYMPAALTAGDGTRVRYDQDPVRYVQVAGINPRSEQDHEALRRYPELALHLLNESVRANSMAKASTGYVAGTAIHASLGTNYPADAKASATYVPRR
ncbi:MULTISPECIES: hypothetical protein [unclassified Paraburkholderia]|uniref:hypothetical protein n=1 Tax=unclassified Paraburkholderia TaxID=2615204 RepID=UPI00161FD18F|nr:MULTISPECIES: hypothetical protein [unclassified Paraburkholderia]MBB5448282.1 hypothetical protein [Paraburkholderia sp. WSM4177]MBB5488663.1 hypothetical protein [Paraburkholderia sp. WSM4180]